ncbi:MAG: hypothetical protein JMDDDDMK_01793 [Acidobacteria bacterium]|nr:hypothetical protein [Acidobacteriota bacterium]
MNSTSKTTLQALGTGLAGAAAAAIANKTVIPGSSRRGFLGKDLVIDTLRHVRFEKPSRRERRRMGVVGDVLANSLSYGFAGGRGAKRNWLRGALLGLGTGLTALAIPQQKRGFWFRPARRTNKAKLATIGRILAGGLAAAAASRLISKAAHRRQSHSLFD